MDERQQGPSPTTPARAALGRRGVLAAMAVGVTGVLAKWTATPAAAGVDGDLVLGATNQLVQGTNNSPTVLKPAATQFGLGPGRVFEIDARPDQTGGTDAMVGYGANAGLFASGGTGVEGIGGAGAGNFPSGGIGVSGSGGTSAAGGNAGIGVEAFGGNGGNPSVSGGVGVRSRGGFGGSPSGVGGEGLVSTGGSGSGSGRDGLGIRGSSGNSGDRPRSIGVLGVSDPNSFSLAVPAQAAGVYGLSNVDAPGVVGQSNNGVGCQGSSNGNVGVLGVSNASVGVYASSNAATGLYATSTSGTGIVASTNNGNAIQGASNGNVGVLGTSNSSIGVYAASNTSTGLYATGPASGFAARFDGPVLVNGNFTAIGGSKSAAVPHPDGTYRRLYCVESPESWFEDFGRDQLNNGRARVRLDPDFNALVHGNHYHVFLSDEGDSNGLYVADRNANSFEVREKKGGSGNHAFSYRIVAKRKDIPDPRLERLDIPAVPPRPAAPPAPPTIAPLPPLRIDPNAAPPHPPERPGGR